MHLTENSISSHYSAQTHHDEHLSPRSACTSSAVLMLPLVEQDDTHSCCLSNRVFWLKI